MRVCLPFIGDTVGGSHLSAILLARGLVAEGLDVELVVHQPGPLATLLTERRIPFELAPPTAAADAGTRAGYARAVVGTTSTLQRFLRSHRTTVVHTNDLRSHRAWMIAAKMAGVPHVWHQRTRFYAPRLGRLQLLVPDRVISVSQYVDATMPRFARGRSRVIANPFDTTAGTPATATARRELRREIAASDEARIVGFVGNLTEQKRPFHFVRVAGEVSRRMPHVHFVLVGGDRSGNAERLRRLAGQLGLTDRVHVLGFRSPIEPAIAAFDVLVAPGVHDGFGRAIVEAMLVGTPVVAADSGGHPEAVDHARTGLLVPPDDVRATAAAVERLLTDSTLRATMAATARADAMERYSVRQHAEAVMETYRAAT